MLATVEDVEIAVLLSELPPARSSAPIDNTKTIFPVRDVYQSLFRIKLNSLGGETRSYNSGRGKKIKKKRICAVAV